MTLFNSLLILLISSIEIESTFLQLEVSISKVNLFFLKSKIAALKMMTSV